MGFTVAHPRQVTEMVEEFNARNTDNRDGQGRRPGVKIYTFDLKDFFTNIPREEFMLELREALQQLADRAQQLRVIEKRLLVRFKDRNPTPLNHLDDLLRMTYATRARARAFVRSFVCFI